MGFFSVDSDSRPFSDKHLGDSREKPVKREKNDKNPVKGFFVYKYIDVTQLRWGKP